MNRTSDLARAEIQTVSPDCLAFCAPGAAITVRLLIERVFLTLRPNPKSPAELQLSADELYECLIKPESGPIKKMLFVSPHSLFNLDDPIGSLEDHVKALPFGTDNDENWHLPPVEPKTDGTKRGIHIHTRQSPSGSGRPFQSFEGSVVTPAIVMPSKLCSSESLAVLSGLGRSVFECNFDPAIPAGTNAWIRLTVNPRQLSHPHRLKNPALEGVGIPIYSQLLDVLGPETMLECFREILANMQNLGELPGTLADELQGIATKEGFETVAAYVFNEGFDAPGTYTRIEDHRILLASNQCRINFIKEEGGVALEAIVPRMIRGNESPVFHWHSGMIGYPHLDPVLAAAKLYSYAEEFAKTEATAKPKVYLTSATEINHLLGCEIISEFEERQYFRKITSKGEGGGEVLYHLNTSPPLSQSQRHQVFTNIATTIGNRRRLPRGHFRILFEALWGEKTPQPPPAL